MAYRIIAAALAVVTSTVGMAADPSPPQSRDSKIRAEASVRQSGGEVCETVQQLGSRLRSQMACMTKQQWADQREQDRQLIDRSQLQICVPGAGNC